MRKQFVLIVIASVLFFAGASPWEGSAAVAPNGELPTRGFYIATNAFPKNTVVDITNIENGKTTRVIVSNSLAGPGLLAVVSREAADLIGMRADSISRIRMVQPADPMAYMRFTERMKEGTPEYDSGNVITEDNMVAQVYKNDTYAPPKADGQVEETEPKTSLMPGYIVDEPEWGGEGRLQIVDVPGYITDPVIKDERSPELTFDPDTGEAALTQREINKDVFPKIDERPPVEVVKYAPEYNPDNLLEGTEEPRKEVVKNVQDFITETPRSEVVKVVSPWQERVEVVTTPPPPVQEQQPPPPPPDQRVLVPVETSSNPPPSSGVYGIDPNDIIPSIVVATPEKPASAANSARATATNPNLPIPTIDRLDRGKYYVQVAAFSPEHIENALKQIDRGYAPVVFKGSDNLYRILIGPLNQGESAAVLSRFKSIGYKDAFVRKGG
jgi:hypothetical protein